MDAHLSEQQKTLAKYIFAYQDLLFSPRSHINGSDILLIVNAHVMNHILKYDFMDTPFATIDSRTDRSQNQEYHFEKQYSAVTIKS